MFDDLRKHLINQAAAKDSKNQSAVPESEEELRPVEILFERCPTLEELQKISELTLEYNREIGALTTSDWMKGKTKSVIYSGEERTVQPKTNDDLGFTFSSSLQAVFFHSHPLSEEVVQQRGIEPLEFLPSRSPGDIDTHEHQGLREGGSLNIISRAGLTLFLGAELFSYDDYQVSLGNSEHKVPESGYKYRVLSGNNNGTSFDTNDAMADFQDDLVGESQYLTFSMTRYGNKKTYNFAFITWEKLKELGVNDLEELYFGEGLIALKQKLKITVGKGDSLSEAVGTTREILYWHEPSEPAKTQPA